MVMVSVWLLANGIPPLFCKVGSGIAAGLLPEVVEITAIFAVDSQSLRLPYP